MSDCYVEINMDTTFYDRRLYALQDYQCPEDFVWN